MRDMALFALMFAFAYAGFLLLALSQQEHWKAIFGRIADRKPRWLRWAGGIPLGLSLLVALYRDGPAFGAILWVVVLIIAASAAVATLTWHAPLLRRILTGPARISDRAASPVHTRPRYRSRRTD